MTGKYSNLNSSELLLRPFEETDQQNVFEGLSHPDVIKYYGVSFFTFEATKEQMDWFKNLEEAETGMWWAVCSPDNKTFYGGGGLNDIDKEKGSGEIGFWLLPKYWGNGIMQKAMNLICDYAFAHMNLSRIEGFVESKNQNCTRAMSKLGFTLEETKVNAEKKGDQYIDLDVYVKLSKE